MNSIKLTVLVMALIGAAQLVNVCGADIGQESGESGAIDVSTVSDKNDKSDATPHVTDESFPNVLTREDRPAALEQIREELLKFYDSVKNAQTWNDKETGLKLAMLGHLSKLLHAYELDADRCNQVFGELNELASLDFSPNVKRYIEVCRERQEEFCATNSQVGETGQDGQ
jgi:hypothetical protein